MYRKTRHNKTKSSLCITLCSILLFSQVVQARITEKPTANDSLTSASVGAVLEGIVSIENYLRGDGAIVDFESPGSENVVVKMKNGDIAAAVC